MAIIALTQLRVVVIAAAGLVGLLAAQLGIVVHQRIAALAGRSASQPASATIGLCAPAASHIAANPRPALFIGCGIIE